MIWRTAERAATSVGLGAAGFAIGAIASFAVTSPSLDAVVLQGRALPGFAILLPEGSDRGSAFHAAGRLDVDPDHPGLEVTVRWGFSEQPVPELGNTSSTLVAGTLVDTTIGGDRDARVAELTWSCSPGSWAQVRLVAELRDDAPGFAALASRIANSVHCFPLPVIPPFYGLRFARPGYVAVPLGDRTTRYEGRDGSSLTLAWELDTHGDRAARRALARVGISKFVTTLECQEAVWAIRYDGPPENALDVIRAARCP